MSDAALARATAAAMWENDRASRGLGMRIEEVGPGFAILSMTVTERMLNGHDICHGGFIFALADSAMAFAVQQPRSPRRREPRRDHLPSPRPPA